MRSIFGPTSDVIGEWRSFHNEELHSLYCSPNIIRVINLGDRDGEVMYQSTGRWECFQNLTVKPIRKRPIGRLRWENNIRGRFQDEKLS